MQRGTSREAYAIIKATGRLAKEKLEVLKWCSEEGQHPTYADRITRADIEFAFRRINQGKGHGRRLSELGRDGALKYRGTILNRYETGRQNDAYSVVLSPDPVKFCADLDKIAAAKKLGNRRPTHKEALTRLQIEIDLWVMPLLRVGSTSKRNLTRVLKRAVDRSEGPTIKPEDQ